MERRFLAQVMSAQRSLLGAIAAAAALGLAVPPAQAQGDAKYPDLKGQWVRLASQGVQWDPGKPPGRSQQAPLTAEYQAVYDAKLARKAAGIPEAVPACLPPGMPRSMIAYEPIEVIVMPDATYIMLSHMSEFRRIFTDGRKFPENIEASYTGYSVGEWKDTDGDGRFDTLLVETRALKGPRAFDDSGIPLHKDNETIVKERIFLDKASPDLLHNEITTIDNALTGAWTVTRSYRRERNPIWDEYVCAETNPGILIGDEVYKLSDDGYLMPTRRGQPAPDLRYFPRR